MARAILLLARLLLLPSSAPVYNLVQMAANSDCASWVSRVRDIMSSSRFSHPIPCILNVFDELVIANARCCKLTRKALIRRYRHAYVKPAFDEYDAEAFAAAASSSSWPYHSFQCSPEAFPLPLLRIDWGVCTWEYYRAWATIKVTGRWPLSVHGAGDLPQQLSVCPLCGVSNVDIVHLLSSCGGTFDLYCVWASGAGKSADSASRLPWSHLQFELFADRISFLTDDPDQGSARINFVGQAVRRAVQAFTVASSA